MRSKVYVETSVISYLTARPSRDLISRGHQQLTRKWWAHAAAAFDLYASRLVLAEAQLGDRAAAAARVAILEPLDLLAENADSRALAERLLAARGLPAKAAADALHIATAAVHGMDYLVTWNCKHIANARTLRVVAETCRSAGFEPPVICTPGAGGGFIMREDPIVRETRAAREQLLQRFHYDLNALCRYLEQLDSHSGKKAVTLKPRRPLYRRQPS